MIIKFPTECPSIPENFGPEWCGPRHRKFFSKHVPQQATKILELGSFVGRSTHTFLELRPQATLYCVDPWEDPLNFYQDQIKGNPLEQFLRNLWPLRDRVIPFQGLSGQGMEYHYYGNLNFDAIYIDGDHSAMMVEFDVSTAVKFWPRATIFGDDFINFPGVKIGLDKFCSWNGKHYRTEGPLWILEN